MTRALDSQALRHDVDAVGLVIDLLMQGFDLALDYLGAVGGAVLDVGIHTFMIYPHGVLVNNDYSLMCIRISGMEMAILIFTIRRQRLLLRGEMLGATTPGARLVLNDNF